MEISVKDWLATHKDIKSQQKLFYNMSRTLNYIHEHDYYVENFNLGKIHILNDNTLSPIQYDVVVRIPNGSKAQIVKDDIYNLAFIQIATYTNIDLNILKPSFLKENFQEFQPFIPQDDYNYLKGIIERGASVYYYQYFDGFYEKQIEKLNEELGEANENGNSLNMQKTKSTLAGRAMVDKETRKLYSELVDSKQAAFISFLIFPFSLILLALILGIIIFIYK